MHTNLEIRYLTVILYLVNFSVLKNSILLVLLIFLSVVTSFCQEIFPLHLEEENGLPSNSVYDIKEDKLGYIWLATNDGLFKYDGYKYISYKSAEQTSFAGSNIHIDLKGRVWYENFDGYLYYVEQNTLQKLKQNPPPDFVPFGTSDKYLFVVQKKGVDVYDIQTLDLLQTLPISISVPEHATVMNNCFYLISDDIIYKIDEQLHISKTDYFKHKKFRVKYIHPIGDELYIVSKNNDEKLLYFFNEQLQLQRTVAIPNISYVQGSTVIDNQILIYTPHGVFAYNAQGEQLWNKKSLLNNYSIACVIKDFQQNYWISALNNGLFIIPDIQHELFVIPNTTPTRIAKIKNGYWLGTREGTILQLDQQFSVQKESKGNNDYLPVSYLHYDSLGDYSVAVSKGFSFIQNNNLLTDQFHNIALKEIVRINEKYAAYAMSGGCILYKNPNSKGVSVWDNVFDKYASNDLGSSAKLLTGLRAKSVTYNPQSEQLIFATNIGIYRVTPTLIEEIKKDANSFYASQVLWIGNDLYLLDTKGNLFKTDPENHWENMNEKWNIPPFAITKIVAQGHNLLILQKQSVTILNTVTHTTQQVRINLGNRKINDALLEDDHLLMVTQEGILKMPLVQNKNNQTPRFFINKVEANQTDIDFSQFLTLPYDQNSIAIDFSVLEYAGNVFPLYYRINGKEWISISNSTRLLAFPSLSAGKYEIEFKVGEEINEQKISFEIATAFWNAWWFYLLCAIAIGIIVYIYFKKESRQMKRQIRLLNEKVILEKNLSKSVMTSIKSQMNPHFFYNALNTIQAYIFTNDRQNANNYLAKFSKLTRIILEMSEQETITLTEEVESLKLYLELEKMRFKDSFEFRIIVGEYLHKDSIEFPPMLIQPYVENAIKHGLLHRPDWKNLTISFEQKELILKVVVEDNGIGRKKSEELNKIKNDKHQSFSTKANGKRLEILHKSSKHKMAINIIDKTDEAGIPTGTRVELFIPLL